LPAYLQTLLTGLDSSDVTSDTATDDDQIVLGCKKPGETGKVSNRRNPISADDSLRPFNPSDSIKYSPASEA